MRMVDGVVVCLWIQWKGSGGGQSPAAHGRRGALSSEGVEHARDVTNRNATTEVKSRRSLGGRFGPPEASEHQPVAELSIGHLLLHPGDQLAQGLLSSRHGQTAGARPFPDQRRQLLLEDSRRLTVT
jgi:hypothetical protein